jgi:hypothetical protein
MYVLDCIWYGYLYFALLFVVSLIVLGIVEYIKFLHNKYIQYRKNKPKKYSIPDVLYEHNENMNHNLNRVDKRLDRIDIILSTDLKSILNRENLILTRLDVYDDKFNEYVGSIADSLPLMNDKQDALQKTCDELVNNRDKYIKLIEKYRKELNKKK